MTVLILASGLVGNAIKPDVRHGTDNRFFGDLQCGVIVAHFKECQGMW